MTETEEILQRALDADPSDQVARRALADLLIELGDPRGDGYRALAEAGRVPRLSQYIPGERYFTIAAKHSAPCYIPSDLLKAAPGFGVLILRGPRRKIEDAVALAYATAPQPLNGVLAPS